MRANRTWTMKAGVLGALFSLAIIAGCAKTPDPTPVSAPNPAPVAATDQAPAVPTPTAGDPAPVAISALPSTVIPAPEATAAPVTLPAAGPRLDPVFIEDAQKPAALAADRDVARLLGEKYPNLKVVTVAQLTLGAATLYEFVASGNGNTPVLGYTDRDVGFLFIGGELVTGDTGSLVNLTRQRAQAASQRVLGNLPTEGTFKMVYGKGERILKMFADPDCPYCRQLEKDMSAQPDKVNATVFIYPFPLGGLHPQADARARHLACTQNPSQAWHDWMVGASGDDVAWSAFAASHPATPCTQASIVDTSLALGKALGLAQTPVLVFENAGVLAATPTLDQLLAELEAVRPRSATP